jgi:hypothetical protein
MNTDLENIFAVLVDGALIYVVCGVLVAALFLARWIRTFDPSAAEGTWGFRVLIVPGIIALWPLILVKVAAVGRGRSAPGEAERPLTADALRRNHRLAFIALAVVGTLLFIVALVWRAPRLADAPVVETASLFNSH